MPALSFQWTDALSIAPIGFLAVVALTVLLVDVFATHTADRSYAGYLTTAGLGLAFLLYARAFSAPVLSTFGGTFASDAFGSFFGLLVCGSAALTALIGVGHLREHGLLRGEFFVLLLLATIGMLVMAQAKDFLVLFVGLELMSLAVYALTAYERHRQKAVEAAFKYFLIGSFATAFLLFGIAFLYGATGGTSYAGVADYVRNHGSPFFIMLGLTFVLAGFLFKVAAVPFHMWTPDAYEGAPTPITAFMAAAVKAAAFAAFLRVFSSAFGDLKLGENGWGNVLWLVAIATMTLGNLVALLQDDIKRMLAYSSIAHAGYLLLGFLTLTTDPKTSGVASVLFYLIGYALMNLGAFAVVAWLSRRGHEATNLPRHYAGVGAKEPLLGVLLAIFLFSLAGIPGTVGFVGKFYVFSKAIEQDLLLIAVVAILNSLVSVYYYLRVLVFMFMAEPVPGEETRRHPSLPLAVAAIASAAAVLLFGLWPNLLLELSQTAARALF